MKKLSKFCKRAHIKPAIILPVLAIMCLGIFAILWQVGPETKAAVGGNAQSEPWTLSNPLFKELVRIPELPADSIQTAELQELFAAAVAAAHEARSSREDFRQVNRAIRSALAEALEVFIRENPNSAWAPSIRFGLGQYYRDVGRHSLALIHWEDTWLQLNQSNQPITKELADNAFAKLTSLLASLGRVEELAILIEATRGRDFGKGGIRLLLNQTLEGYAQMVSDPASAYRCGSLALANMARKLNASSGTVGAFLKAGSPETGFTAQQLVAMAHSQNLRVSAVIRDGGAHLIVPSVVHWAQEHYAAIVEKRGNDYLVVDATFGAPKWMKVETIEAESSGVFIVPTDQLVQQSGYRLLSDLESSSVRGRGNPNHTGDWFDSNCETCPCPPGQGGAGSGGSGNGSCRTCANGIGPLRRGGHSVEGMAQWRVSEPYLNLWIHDEPWSYLPSKGEKISPHLAYKQRNIAYWGPHSQIEGTTFGSFWEFNYWSQLATDWPAYGQGYSFWVEIGLPGGGFAHYEFDGVGSSATNFYNNSILSYSYDANTDTVTNFTLVQVDGRKLIYDQAVPDGLGDNYDYALSRIVSPEGAETVLEYANPSQHVLLLQRIIDVDLGTNTVEYYTNTYEVASITSATGQVAEFEYDSDVYGNRYLVSITDAVGIQSEFGYDYNGYASSITTPYGTTSFEFTDLNDPWAYELERRVTITHPDTSKECYMWFTSWYAATNSYPSSKVPSGTRIGTLENTYLNHRNSWYWNRQQYANLSTAFRTSGSYADLTEADKKKGRWRHWLQRFWWDAAHYEVAGLSLERDPSPSSDASVEGQITWYDYADKYSGDPSFTGPQLLPSEIARVMPDGSTWYEYHERNKYGHTTNMIEKWELAGTAYFRTNRYVYATNDIDLLEHWKTHEGGEHRVVGYSYNSNHQPLTMTNALGEVTTYTYSGNKLNTLLTPSGLLSTYTYNGTSGLLEKVVDSISGSPVRTNSYTWEYGLVKTHTDERGLTITNYWDELDRLSVRYFSDGSYIQNLYYLFPGHGMSGNGTNILDVTASRDQNGNWTFYDYTPLRQLEHVTNTLGVVTRYEYCSCGGPEYIREAYGTPVEFATQQLFDYQGRLTHVFKPGGINITNQYDVLGNLTNRMDALGSTTNWFDNLGRIVLVSNAFGQVSQSIYDVEGMVRTNMDANGVSTIFTYDDLHRIRSQMLVGGGTNTWGYTANVSAPTSHTNELGKVTQYAYNALGWKTDEVIVGMSTNSFTYSAAGDLRTLSDGKSQVTKWGYDTFGRVTSKTNAANTQIIRYSYHLDGSLSNRWTAAKGNTVYSYDAVGNLTNVNYAASTDLRFKYDAMNRVTNMVDAAGTTTNYYDVANRFMIEDGPWANDTVTNRWNTAGLPESIDVLQPSSYYNIAFKYDSARRMTNVNGTAGSFTNYFITGLNSVTSPSRLMRQISLPNTAFITNYYDGLARLTNTTLRTSGGVDRNLHYYTYNYGHQRTQQTRKDLDYVDYLYDDAGQLYSAKTYDSGHTETTSQRRGYTYDPAWNLTKTTNNTTVSTRTVNNLNQITVGTSGNYGYDNNGNRASIGSGTTYTYDDENQLTKFEENAAFISGANKTEFTYDGKGRLRKRVEYDWNSTFATWTQVSDTRYIYSGMLAIQERNGSNVPEVSYTRGWDLSSSLEGAGGIGGLLARSHGYSSGAWSTHNFYHADGNGNITMMVDSSQATVATYKYDPYGNSFTASGSLSSANLYRFSSKLWCANAGLYYYGYRFYDPSLQRWLNRDPIQEEGGINLYSFVGNSPTSRVDPDGRLVFLAPVVAPAVVKGIGLGASVLAAGWLGELGQRAIEALTPEDPGPAPLPLPKPPRCEPSKDRDERCQSALNRCLMNPWNPPDRQDQWGKRKDCRSCYNECLNDGEWPSYKCADN
jgi:RHS repeat-associated protein